MNLIRDIIQENETTTFLITSTHSGASYNDFPQSYKDIILPFQPTFVNNLCYLNFSYLSHLLDFVKCFDAIISFEDRWSIEIYDDYRE